MPIIKLVAALDTDDIIESLCDGDASHDEIFDFIVDLDDQVCCLEFTKRLLTHFTKIVEENKE